MKIKDVWKKFYANKNLFILVCVAILTVSSIGVSYSAFFTVKSNTSNQTVTTGNLQVTYTGSYLSSSSMNNEKLLPVSDTEGLNQNNARVINVQNTGSLDSEYVLTIGYDMTAFNALSDKDTAKLTPIEFIKFAVYEVDTSTSNNTTLVAGPLSIADLPIYTYDENNYQNNRYLILKNTLKGTESTEGGTTKSYQIKVWLADTTTPAASQTYFYVNSEVEATVEGAKQNYTLNGSLLGADGTALNGATINIQNGSFKSSTDALGTFKLINLPEGTYNVEISANSSLYKGNITIQKKDNYSITKTEDNFTPDAGKKLFEYANIYKTTVKSIMDLNNIRETSDTDLIVQSYILGSSYIINCNSSSISNLKITLDDNNKTFTVSV